jgi:hypothetical protein
VEQPTLESNLGRPIAFCAESSEQDPNCKDKSGYCTPETAVTCREGFAIESVPCTSPKACTGDGHCKDPRCAGFAGNEQFCDGQALVACDWEGNSREPIQCLVTCVTVESLGFCALSADPDPRCASVEAYCDDNTAVECHRGFGTSRRECTPIGICTVVPVPGSDRMTAGCSSK